MIGILFGPSNAFAKPKKSYLGYVFPAGAQQGTTIEAIVGGQYLKKTSHVIISGKGVRAEVMEVVPFDQQLFNEARHKTRIKIMNEFNARKEKGKKTNGSIPYRRTIIPLLEYEITGSNLSREFNKYADDQLKEISNQINGYWRTNQKNRQLNERVRIRITIDKNAKLGIRTLRLLTGNRLSSPIRFKIDHLKEFKEIEPNNLMLKNQATIQTPMVMNGQILPGDVDRYFFRAKKGDDLVAVVEARSLIPFLADAVPGWFQATLTLYNPQNKKVEFQDDYQLRPDPVLFYKVPTDGVYSIAIQDAIFRGRVDFIYRLSIGNLPFITSHFPLGFQRGKKAVMKLNGKNLTTSKINLTRYITKLPTQTIQVNYSNPISFQVGTLPECIGFEPNETKKAAQKIQLPVVINGIIDKPGDLDFYSFIGKKGQKIVMEVVAKPLESPLDSVIYLMDKNGKTLAWNDEVKQQNLGDQTHHSDSYVRTTLPESGKYYIKIIDAQNAGGPASGYRLRVSEPIPDFRVIITPSSLSLSQNEPATIEAILIRKDGFDGPVKLSSMNSGVKLYGALFPKGQTKIKFTILASNKNKLGKHVLKFKAKSVGSPTIIGTCITADDVMQAFLYRHLLLFPEMNLWLNRGRNRDISFVKIDEKPISLPKGKSVKFRRKLTKRINHKNLSMSVIYPTKGITVRDFQIKDKLYLEFTILTDKNIPNYVKDNLVISLKQTIYRQAKKKFVKKNKSVDSKLKTKETPPKEPKKIMEKIIRPFGIIQEIPFTTLPVVD